MLLKYLFPQTDDFFKVFRDTAQEFAIVAIHFKTLLDSLNTDEPVETSTSKTNTLQVIRDHEKRADALINQAFNKLHKTFITPFDRYDIHRFVKKLNEGIESILETAERIEIYKLQDIPQEIHSMADLIVDSTAAIVNATKRLHSMREVPEILRYCDRVKDLEGKGEALLLSGVARLFKEEADIKRLLKTKEIYEHTKLILNECEVVANILKDIVLEYS